MFSKKNIFLTYLLAFLFFNSSCSQTMTAKKGSFGVDQKHHLVIWHISDLNNNLNLNKVSEITFDNTYTLKNGAKKLSYENAYKISSKGIDFTLYITKLPVVHTTLDTSTLNSDKKFGGYITYFSDGNFIESPIGIRQRGNLSLTFPKKSYDIEVWNDTISKEKKDLKFADLRDDDDWILDGLYNEPLKARAQVASELWTDIHQPYYKNEEPDAKSTFESRYVELFVNGNYNGLYGLSESVDRKQLKLKKSKDSVIRGELFKANSYAGGPDFKVAGSFNNAFPHYVGWRMEYPVIDYESYWNELSETLELVVNGTDDAFTKGISDKLHLENVIDYYLFINTIGAVDNFGKNYYLAKYNTNEPYFFVPWDLDSSFGLVQNAQKYTVTDRTFSNNLFDRLIAINPNDFNGKLKKRWNDLRASKLSNDEVLKRFDDKYTNFSKNKLYERDALIWPKKTSDADDYNYLKDWIKGKMSYLDGYIKNL